MTCWQYDEFKQVGTDYGSIEEVKAYDERMQRLRDVKGEISEVLDSLALTPDSTLVEIGCGTGEFTIAAAAKCKTVYAVDVSETMLQYARTKATARSVTNIEYIRAGFLTYEHAGIPVEVVVSHLALHHLPDFWKAVALRKIHDTLRPGGLFHLKDVVFTFEIDKCTSVLQDWIDHTRAEADDTNAQAVEAHIKGEYSTMGWIMEGLLLASGFDILDTSYSGDVFATYLCARKP